MVCLRGATTEDFEDQNKRHGYALGANYGRLLKQNGVEVDLDMFFQGMKDYIADQSLMEDADIAAATKEINELVSQRRKAEQDRIAGENLEKGKAFLEENRAKEGVKVLASGLQYKVISEGTGAVPTASDKVTVHYRGTFLDGKEFDSSYSRGKPASFNVTGVIRGWTEALQLMSVGSKWQLFIPSDLPTGRMAIGTFRRILPFSSRWSFSALKPAPSPSLLSRLPVTSSRCRRPRNSKKGLSLK